LVAAGIGFIGAGTILKLTDREEMSVLGNLEARSPVVAASRNRLGVHILRVPVPRVPDVPRVRGVPEVLGGAESGVCRYRDPHHSHLRHR
jgi:hypothetical protein